MPKVKDAAFYESSTYNSFSFRNYYDNIMELAISMWDWKNLPDSIDPRFMELVLFGDGKAIWFNDEVMGPLVLRENDSGRFDQYDIPIYRNAYSNNGFHISLDNSNSVIIYNNMIRTATRPVVEYYAKRLWDIDRTMDNNINAQKTPYIIACDENQLLTLKNIYAKLQGNEKVIYANKGLDPNSIQVLNTNAPFVAPALYELRTKIYNECLEKLGIPTVQNEKGERLLVAEVAQGNGSINANRNSRLESRRLACEKINKMFDLDIWVDYRDLNRRETEGTLQISGKEAEE